MLDMLLLALAAVQPAPPGELPLLTVEGAFRLVPSGAGGRGGYLTIGNEAASLSFGCEMAVAGFSAAATVPEEIGIDIAYPNRGGFRFDFTFDAGRPLRQNWSASGKAAITYGQPRLALRLAAALRSTRSVAVTVRGERRRVQRITFNYPDPTALIDEVAQRCGVTLER